MTFTNTIVKQTVMGPWKVVMGSTENDSTSGEVNTGLSHIDHFTCNGIGDAAVEISINEDFPLGKGAVTVVTENGKDFIWIAYGR